MSLNWRSPCRAFEFERNSFLETTRPFFIASCTNCFWSVFDSVLWCITFRLHVLPQKVIFLLSSIWNFFLLFFDFKFFFICSQTVKPPYIDNLKLNISSYNMLLWNYFSIYWQIKLYMVTCLINSFSGVINTHRHLKGFRLP